MIMIYTTRNGNASMETKKTYMVSHGWGHVRHQTLTFLGIDRPGVFGSTTLRFQDYKGDTLILCEDQIRSARV